MPLPWLLLHVDTPPAVLQQNIQQTGPETFGDITVTHKSIVGNEQTGVYEITDGTVTYDLTTIQADHVTIERKTKHAIATGHVHLFDPVGTIEAEKIEIWWGEDIHSGVVSKGTIHVGTASIHFDRVDINPTQWTITKARGTTSKANPPWFEVGSPQVVIYPGKRGKIKRPTLYILGARIITFPDRYFNLDPKSEGLGIPSLRYQPGQGLGVGWAGGILLDRSTNFAFGFGSFPHQRPSYGATVTRSFLPEEKAVTLITPTSDFSERFIAGYLETIHVDSPSQEEGNYRIARKSLAVDSIWNTGAIGRGNGAAFSKAAEAVYEIGGASGKFGYVAQSRIQTIQQIGNPFETRGMLVGAVSMPSATLAPNLRTLARVDSSLFAGSNLYGWTRAIVGLTYQPFKQFRFTGGFYGSVEGGHPDFSIDQLVSKQGMSFRLDLNLGPTKLSYISKYDISRKWFDHEYSLSQVVGCFEPFVLYRQYPAEYAFGLRLNISDLTDLIQKRNFQRPKSKQSVISPMPNGKP